MSWSWLVSSGLVCLSLGLAPSASVAAFSLALNIAFRALTLGLDKSTNCAKEAPLFVEKLDVRGTRPLTEEARLFSTGSARALYSLLGSMDTVAPFLTAPTFTLKVPNRWGLFTEPALPTRWGLGVGKDNLAKPSFRPYLGEWRRLLDQPTSAKASGAGAAYLNRTKQNYNPLRPAVRRPAVAPKGGFRPLADAATKPYYVYLTSPWVF